MRIDSLDALAQRDEPLTTAVSTTGLGKHNSSCGETLEYAHVGKLQTAALYTLLGDDLS